MGSCDHDIVSATQEVSPEHLGQRGVVQLAVKDRLDLGIAAGDGVADHDERLFLGKVFGSESSAHINPTRC